MFPSVKDLQMTARTIRRFADSQKPGICIWYDCGADMMNWLFDNFGGNFNTSKAMWLKIAGLIDRIAAERAKEGK